MNKRLFNILVMSFVFSLLFMTNVTTSTNLSENELTTAITNADVVAIYDSSASTDITVDGVIGATEYPETFHSDYVDMDFSVAHNESFLFVGFSAPTTGYAAIGFNEKGFGMVGADIKYGSVRGNETTATDYIAKLYGFPSSDKNDIAQSAGTENNGQTVIEMVLPMNPSESTITGQDQFPKDRKLEVNNTYSLMLAWGNTEGMSLHHKKGVFSIFIAPEGVNARTDVKTTFQLTGAATGDKFTNFLGTTTLTDNSGNKLAGKTISVIKKGLISDVILASGTTDANGTANFNFSIYQEYSSSLEVYVMFNGDLQYKKGQSDLVTIDYTGVPETEFIQFEVIPRDLNGLVPYITGFGALAIVAGLWLTFVYVIYTVLFLNATKPNEKENNGGMDQ